MQEFYYKSPNSRHIASQKQSKQPSELGAGPGVEKSNSFNRLRSVYLAASRHQHESQQIF